MEQIKEMLAVLMESQQMTNARLDGMSADFNARFEALSTDFNARLDGMSADFNARFEALSTDFNQFKEETNGKLDYLTTEMVELRQDVNELKIENIAIKNDVRECKTDIKQVKGSLQYIGQKLMEHDQEIYLLKHGQPVV